MHKLADLGFENGDAMISLSKLTGKTITDIALAPMRIRGTGTVWMVCRVDFSDGTHLNAHGDRDIPYVAPGRGLTQPGFEAETIDAMYDEWHGEDDD